MHHQGNNPDPCFLRYYGGPGEILSSYLSSLVEPVSVENERSYCPFDDLEISGRGQVTDILGVATGTIDIDILTCARNQERCCTMDTLD